MSFDRQWKFESPPPGLPREAQTLWKLGEPCYYCWVTESVANYYQEFWLGDFSWTSCASTYTGMVASLAKAVKRK